MVARIICDRVSADGMKISGTKIEVNCDAKAYVIPDEPPVAQDPIMAVRLKRALLTIGEQEIYNDTFTPVWGPEAKEVTLETGDPAQQLPEWSDILSPRECRFASNHFISNSTVPIQLTLTFEYRRNSGAVAEFPNTVTSTINPKAYNELCAWKMTLDSYGNPFPMAVQGVIDLCYEKIVEGYTSAKYESGPGAESASAAILQRIRVSTAIGTPAHGSQISVRDSYGPEGSMLFTTIKDNIQHLGDRYASPVIPVAMPPMTAYFLYSCSTYPGQPENSQYFMFWRSPLAPAEAQLNSFGGGFDKTLVFIDPTVGVKKWDNIYKHPEALFLKLTQGFPTFHAMKHANDTFPPLGLVNGNLEPVPMKFHSGVETMTTLLHVYLTLGERQAIDPTTPNPWDNPSTAWFVRLPGP